MIEVQEKINLFSEAVKGLKKHYKSVFTSETELLRALIEIHFNGQDIDLDPMYFKGNFYKDGVKVPKMVFDLNPQDENITMGNAEHLPLESDSIERMILDPPFLFGVHGKAKEYYSSRTHTIYQNFDALYVSYENILKEAYRLLEKGGHLIFKCQDYTDSSTTMTHCIVFHLATLLGFYAKDLAILVKPNKITNPNTTQRHLRKIHTYFWVFKK